MLFCLVGRFPEKEAQYEFLIPTQKLPVNTSSSQAVERERWELAIFLILLEHIELKGIKTFRNKTRTPKYSFQLWVNESNVSGHLVVLPQNSVASVASWLRQ